MTPRDFCYWLQGYFQFNDATTLDGAQAKAIADRLAKTEKRTPAGHEKTPIGFAFCQRMSGVFDIVEPSSGLTGKQVAKIKAQLAEAFRDELDAAADDDYRRDDSYGRGSRFSGRGREEESETAQCLC